MGSRLCGPNLFYKLFKNENEVSPVVGTHGGRDEGWSQMGWDLPAPYTTNPGETEADCVARAGVMKAHGPAQPLLGVSHVPVTTSNHATPWAAEPSPTKSRHEGQTRRSSTRG